MQKRNNNMDYSDIRHTRRPISCSRSNFRLHKISASTGGTQRRLNVVLEGKRERKKHFLEDVQHL